MSNVSHQPNLKETLAKFFKTIYLSWFHMSLGCTGGNA